MSRLERRGSVVYAVDILSVSPMSIRTKIILITLVSAVASFAVGPLLWQPTGAPPSSSQLPFLILISVLESIAFGGGIAFLVLAWPLTKRVPKDMRRTATVLYFAIGWYLISWWPHDNMHMSNGENMWRLIVIEYLFHVTLIVAAIVVAFEVFQLLRREAGVKKV